MLGLYARSLFVTIPTGALAGASYAAFHVIKNRERDPISIAGMTYRGALIGAGIGVTYPTTVPAFAVGATLARAHRSS